MEKSKLFKYRVLPDIVTAFIEARWRWTLVYCILTYMLIRIFFAAVWWIIMYVHGDFDEGHMPDCLNSIWTPCIQHIYGYTCIFLFSVVVHTTVGYESSHNSRMPYGLANHVLRKYPWHYYSIFYSRYRLCKINETEKSFLFTHTLIFSKNAIVNERDGEMCFVFRIGNTRKSRIIGARINAYFIRCVISGDVLHDQIELNLSVDSSMYISFPMSVIHKINECSPSYTLSTQDMSKVTLEIMVIFEGVIGFTGQPVQAKSSYTAQEILWGCRFVPAVNYMQGKKGFVVDYLKFNEYHRVNTLLCSAEKLNIFYRETLGQGHIIPSDY